VNNDLHQRANELLTRRRAEPLSRDDEQWLNAHVSECAACAVEELRLAEALSAFRTMHIDLPRNLASRTQLRVRMRAEELHERSSSVVFLWAIVAMSWALGVATAPLVWAGFAWASRELHLPRYVAMAGVALWWLVPGLLAAGAVLLRKRGAARGTE
jgi:hypothetical protein